MFEPEVVTIDNAMVGRLITLTIALTIAVYLELKESRIPNWLTFPAMAVGLGLGAAGGSAALGSAFGGLLLGFGFLFMFYVFGGVGGGDVKLMGAVGALVGLEMIVPALFYTAFIGGFMAVMLLIWRREFWSGLARSARVLASRKSEDEEQTEKPGITVPYGVAIAAGSVMALFLK